MAVKMCQEPLETKAVHYNEEDILYASSIVQVSVGKLGSGKRIHSVDFADYGGDVSDVQGLVVGQNELVKISPLLDKSVHVFLERLSVHVTINLENGVWSYILLMNSRKPLIPFKAFSLLQVE